VGYFGNGRSKNMHVMELLILLSRFSGEDMDLGILRHKTWILICGYRLRGKELMAETGDEMDQFNDIRPLQVFGKDISRTFFLGKLMQDQAHVMILTVVQQVNRPRVSGDVLQRAAGNEIPAKGTEVTSHIAPGEVCDHVQVFFIDNDDHAIKLQFPAGRPLR
jgi:hypothetical protein